MLYYYIYGYLSNKNIINSSYLREPLRETTFISMKSQERSPTSTNNILVNCIKADSHSHMIKEVKTKQAVKSDTNVV